MQAAIDQALMPRCSGCGDSEDMALLKQSYRGPYFYMHCCNSFDKHGRLVPG
jgi:hypothetical protein